MIFVILGTQDKQFPRLIKKIENFVENKIINEQVIIQSGSTKYKSDRLNILDYISSEDFNNYIEKANFVITHGGVGSIIDSLKHNKKVIAVARDVKYKEHVNNHQYQIIENFSQSGYILGCKDLDDLENKIKEINNFKPKKYIENNDNFIKIVKQFIEK